MLSPPPGTFVNTQSFTLRIIEPCPFSVITGPTTVENFVVFAGFSGLSKEIYSYNDTKSLSNTLATDVVDFCGEKEFLFTLDGSATTLFEL